MSYRYTLADGKESGALNAISGVCPNSDEFLTRMNEAQERLIDAGNWHGTEWLVKLCVYNNCLVLPRYVGTVLGLRICGQQVAMKNHWWKIIGTAYSCFGANWGHGFGGYSVATEQNDVCTYNFISGTTGKLIRAYCLKKEDVGKTLTIFGTDFNNQPLMQKVNGAWELGLTLVHALPFASTSVAVKTITSVVREATQGNVMLYEYDVATDKLRDLAKYEPSETNPRYRATNIAGLCVRSSGCEDANGDKVVCIEALVKLAFIPLKNDNDFLVIDNWTALKYMFQACRAEENGDVELGGRYEQMAIRSMNLRDRNLSPPDQTSVKVSPMSEMIFNPI